MSEFISVKEASIQWNLSERTVRNDCSLGRVDGAILMGKTWKIPVGTKKPIRANEKEGKNYLLERLRLEKKNQIKGGICHKLMIDLTFHSNHMEGNKLTHDETRYIFETRTIGIEKNTSKKVDDILETMNHFAAIDRVIDFANYPLSEAFIKELHGILKSNTVDSRLPYFVVGDYKKMPNEVGGLETTHPKLVGSEMKKLLSQYSKKGKPFFGRNRGISCPIRKDSPLSRRKRKGGPLNRFQRMSKEQAGSLHHFRRQEGLLLPGLKELGSRTRAAHGHLFGRARYR